MANYTTLKAAINAVTTPPTMRNLHNKEEPQTARIQKGHPKYSNLNKMKRQRNIQ